MGAVCLLYLVGYIGDYNIVRVDWDIMNAHITEYCVDCTSVLPPLILEQWYYWQERITSACISLIWLCAFSMYRRRYMCEIYVVGSVCVLPPTKEVTFHLQKVMNLHTGSSPIFKQN